VKSITINDLFFLKCVSIKTIQIVENNVQFPSMLFFSANCRNFDSHELKTTNVHFVGNIHINANGFVLLTISKS
jgi:hypothetical protein